MKLEMKVSMDIHWENFELQKSWLDYSSFVSFSFKVSPKMGFCFSKGLGLNPDWLSRRRQLLSLQPRMVGGTTQRWINTKLQFCCSQNLETYHRIDLRLISISFLHFQSLLRFMKGQFGVIPSLLMILV